MKTRLLNLVTEADDGVYLKKESKMNRITLWVLLSVLSAVQVVQAGETTMIPIKGEIHASGEVDLIIRVYDQPEGGRLLYQVTKMVTVENQIFDAKIYVPSDLFSANPQFFVGFASASAPEDEIGERMQFTQRVAKEQATDEELRDPGLAAEIAEEKMALVDTEAISPQHDAPCGTVPRTTIPPRRAMPLPPMRPTSAVARPPVAQFPVSFSQAMTPTTTVLL